MQRGMRFVVSGVLLAALGVAGPAGCGVDPNGDDPVDREASRQALPIECSVDPNGAACQRAALDSASLAFGAVRSILGALGNGASMDEKAAALSDQLLGIQNSVAALQTQVADLTVTIGAYQAQNIKILVFDRFSELANLPFDLQFVRRNPAQLDTRATILRYTNDLATFMTYDELYLEDPVKNWHTPLYTGMGLLGASAGYAIAIENEASLDTDAWQFYYATWGGRLTNYATQLRKVSTYATEWATANTSLALAPLGPDEYYFVPITRPCPTTMIAVGCGYNPDYVGKVCRCRYPDWELRWKGHLRRTIRANLAGTCKAPTAARSNSTNPCMAYAKYKAEFDKGAAEFGAAIGVADFLAGADSIDAYVVRNAPAPTPP